MQSFSYRKKKNIKKGLNFLFNRLLLFKQENIIKHSLASGLATLACMGLKVGAIYSHNSRSLLHNYHSIHCPSWFLVLTTTNKFVLGNQDGYF